MPRSCAQRISPSHNDKQLRQIALAVRAALAASIGAALMGALVPFAHAQSALASQASSTFQVPAGPLNQALMNFAAQDFIDYWFKQHDKIPPQIKDFHEARKIMWNEGIDFYITL